MADILSRLAEGFGEAFTVANLIFAFCGVLIGTLVGVLPGIGPVTAIALLIPLSFGLDPVSGLILLSGIYYGSMYGGSTTSILIRTPGEVASVVTTLDGYEMAKQGRAGLALSTAAIGPFVAGTSSTLGLMLLAPALASVAIAFGSAEYFLLMLLALVMVSNLTTGSQLKAIIATLFGLSVAMVGIDPQTSVQRFTFGVPYLSDGLEKRLSKHPEQFGRGAIEGVAGPETANNAGVGGAMVPLFTLGIPGSATTALLLFVFMMYGLQPGPQLFDTNPELIWAIIASMYIGNVMLLVLNLPRVGLFAQLLKTPPAMLYSGVIAFSVLAAYALNFNVFDMLMLLGFGLVGYLLQRYDFPMAPAVLALVLGILAEQHLRRALSVSNGDLMTFVERPISLALLVFIVLVLVLPPAIRFLRARQAARHRGVVHDGPGGQR